MGGKVDSLRQFLWPALLVAVALPICINADSFWTDEITTAWLCRQPTLGEFWHALGKTGSEAQMPLFSVYSWTWARMFGSGEIALRLANLPWMLILILAMQQLFVRSGCRRGAILLLLAPLVCYQMNEARPYIMTLATAAVTVTGLESLLVASHRGEPPRREDRLLLPLGLLLCVATSMLNLFLLPALLLYAVARGMGSDRQRWGEGPLRFLRARRGSLFVIVAGLIALLVYYAWSVSAGHGGRSLPYTLANFIFSGYEWLGFGGLGVPRNTLREIGMQAALQSSWPRLVAGAVAWLLVAAAAVACRRRIRSDGMLGALLITLAGGAAILTLAAIVAPASIWGRHYLFLMPLLLLLLGRGLVPSESREGRRIALAAFVFLLCIFVLSSARQRFDPAFRKDPYRDAVVTIREDLAAYGELPVVWAAYPRAFLIYGGQFRRWEAPPGPAPEGVAYAVSADMWSRAQIDKWSQWHPEYLLLLHRPDTMDPEGRWREIISQPSSALIWQQGNMRIYHVDAR